MITIDRGKEPKGLQRARERNRLPTAMAAFEQHGSPSPVLTSTLVGYGSAATKRTLYFAQHKKCAWCERRRDLSSNPVEHYRPKDGAWRHKRGETPKIDDERYWWLTWTWENLLFSCTRCNDQGHKGNYFPLKPKSSPLATPRSPVARPPSAGFFSTDGERALLLDPTRHDPMKHIQ